MANTVFSHSVAAEQTQQQSEPAPQVDPAVPGVPEAEAAPTAPAEPGASETPAQANDDALKPMLEAMRARKAGRDHGDLLSYFAEASDCLKVVDGEGNTYKAGAVRRVAKVLDVSPSTVRTYANVARVFDWDAFRAIAGRTNSRGHHLSFSTIVEIVGVKDPEKRQEHLEAVFAESLSIRGLRDRIKSQEPGAQADSDTSAPVPETAPTDAGEAQQAEASTGSETSNDAELSREPDDDIEIHVKQFTAIDDASARKAFDKLLDALELPPENDDDTCVELVLESDDLVALHEAVEHARRLEGEWKQRADKLWAPIASEWEALEARRKSESDQMTSVMSSPTGSAPARNTVESAA